MWQTSLDFLPAQIILDCEFLASRCGAFCVFYTQQPTTHPTCANSNALWELLKGACKRGLWGDHISLHSTQATCSQLVVLMCIGNRWHQALTILKIVFGTAWTGFVPKLFRSLWVQWIFHNTNCGAPTKNSSILQQKCIGLGVEESGAWEGSSPARKHEPKAEHMCLIYIKCPNSLERLACSSLRLSIFTLVSVWVGL